MALLKTPVAADIFTEEFIRDVGTTNIEELFAQYGAGVGEVMANTAGNYNSNQPGDYSDRAAIGSRGVAGKPLPDPIPLKIQSPISNPSRIRSP